MNYSKEVKEKWGKTAAYAEYSAKVYSQEQQKRFEDGMGDIFREAALCMQSGALPASCEAQRIVKKLQNYISENFYNCTDEILLGLGKMYAADERFKKSINKYSDGTAEFVSEAILCRLK